MQRIGRKFRGFKDAEEAELQYYAALTIDQRMLLARQLLEQIHGDLSKLPDVRQSRKTTKGI
ncbi:hypothetical protein HY605_03945 [Candidatus Peregrinibacteria bacterium]|nr:hypothetical protein [Candidatus Peregrinibacteria bacterium]